MIKVLNIFFIIIFGISVSIEAKYKSFDKILKKKSIFFLFCLSSFKFSRSLKLINFLYKKNIFSCLIASILIKKLKNHNQDYKICIGVKKTISKFDMHAWVLYKSKVIFGENKHLKEFLLIYDYE